MITFNRDMTGWKTLIERNPKLETVSTNNVNRACFKVVVEGSNSHGKLQGLKHEGDPVFESKCGTFLRGLLQN